MTKQMTGEAMTTFERDLTTLMALGFKLKTTENGTIRFPLYNIDTTPIDNIELSQRSLNSCKRDHLFTLGDICEKTAEGPTAENKNSGLMKIRGLGKESKKEILNKTLTYAYDMMSENQKKRFWKEVIAE